MTNKNQTRASEKRRKYIELRLEGAEPAQAARLAGFTSSDASTRMERHAEVKKALDQQRDAIVEKGLVTKEENVARLIEAFEIAKSRKVARDMVGAIAELNKMMGFHAPQQVQGRLEHDHKHEHDIGEKTQKALENLSRVPNERLLECIGGEDGLTVIEGEYEVVNDD